MSVRSAIAVLAVLAVIGLLTFGLLSKGSSGVALGEVAPAPPAPPRRRRHRSLAEYRGRWVLVNFWASWCIPCRQEAPALEDFQHRNGDAGFTVLGIDSRDLSGDGRAFVRRYGLSYPQLRDGDGATAHDSGPPECRRTSWSTPGEAAPAAARARSPTNICIAYVAPLLASGKS